MSGNKEKKSADGALKEYDYSDAVETAKAYFRGDELAATVWASTP